jgi:hypothetical protein
MRFRRAALLGLGFFLWLSATAWSEPVAVRFPEGVTRAFPAVRSLEGKTLAFGDFVQVAREDRVHSRLLFRFKDGSVHDENVVFSQRGVFRMESYRLIQKGPSFPETLEVALDRQSGVYSVRHRADEDSPEEIVEGKFEVPDDAYNGMLTLILKNLPAGAGDTVSMVAFTPKPRVVKLKLTPMADEQVTLNESPMQAVRYIVKPELGFFASLLLFDLPSLRCWILPGEAPAFLKAEGPLYFMGPVWRIEPF